MTNAAIQPANITRLSSLPSSSRSSGSSPNGRNAGIALKMLILQEEFEDAFERKIPKSLDKEIRRDIYWYQTDWRYYLYAIREAAKAPKPSWFYAEAVLRRVKREEENPDALCVDALPDGGLIDFEAAET